MITTRQAAVSATLAQRPDGTRVRQLSQVLAQAYPNLTTPYHAMFGGQTWTEDAVRSILQRLRYRGLAESFEKPGIPGTLYWRIPRPPTHPDTEDS